MNSVVITLGTNIICRCSSDFCTDRKQNVECIVTHRLVYSLSVELCQKRVFPRPHKSSIYSDSLCGVTQILCIGNLTVAVGNKWTAIVSLLSHTVLLELSKDKAMTRMHECHGLIWRKDSIHHMDYREAASHCTLITLAHLAALI